jgi:hypothetical protein
MVDLLSTTNVSIWDEGGTYSAEVTDDNRLQVDSLQSLSTSGETYGNISVTATATLIIAANTSRRWVKITNNSSRSIYLGWDASVTTTTGDILYRRQSIIITGTTSAVYGIVSTGTNDVRYLEV